MKKFVNKQWIFSFMLSLMMVALCTVGIVQSVRAYGYDDYYNDDTTTDDVVNVAENAYIREIQNTSSTSLELTITTDQTEKNLAEYYNYYTWNANYFSIYRSNTEDGEYTLVKTDKVNDNLQYGRIVYKDTNLSGRTMYYYKVQMLTKNANNEVVSTGELSAAVGTCTMGMAPKFSKIKATKPKTYKATWKKGSDIDGLDLYIINSVDAMANNISVYESQYMTIGSGDTQIDLSKFNPYKSYGLGTASCTYKKGTHGQDTYFILRPYVNVNGKKIQSNTVFVDKKVMDYYFCPAATDPKFFVKRPKTQKKCAKMMKTVKVKTWEYANHQKHKGKKITKTLYIQVNKTLAPTVKQIYKELYKNKAKPVIYEAGSYRWRPGETDWSYHTIGAAIDMNVNENPFYEYNSKGKRKISVGSFYKPKTNPYSFPRHGIVENTFEKYGFYRLDNDLMHFEAHIERY